MSILNVDFYHSAPKCHPLFKEGEIYSNSFECGCDFTCTNNVCIKMFSLLVGANTNHWEACQTAKSFEIKGKNFVMIKGELPSPANS